jgi:hypothetical protein
MREVIPQLSLRVIHFSDNCGARSSRMLGSYATASFHTFRSHLDMAILSSPMSHNYDTSIVGLSKPHVHLSTCGSPAGTYGTAAPSW